MGRNSVEHNTLIKRQRVQFIAECFCKTMHSLNHHSAINNELILHEVGLSESDKKDYVLRVKKAYGKLDYVNQMFINNEFFFEDKPYWWMKIYSRATFYRLKNKAVESFLGYFDGEI